ncbi:hypothetical protein ACFQ0B_58710 [Nonomuraea thailandensis]
MRLPAARGPVTAMLFARLTRPPEDRPPPLDPALLDATLPHLHRPDALPPGAARPGAAGPDAAGPDAAGPDAAGPDAAGPDAAGPLLDRAGAVLADCDFQLALFACYELHYQGFDDVDDRWEWDPALLAARAVLERRFEEALARAVPRPYLDGPQGCGARSTSWSPRTTARRCPGSWHAGPTCASSGSSSSTGRSTT